MSAHVLLQLILSQRNKSTKSVPTMKVWHMPKHALSGNVLSVLYLRCKSECRLTNIAITAMNGSHAYADRMLAHKPMRMNVKTKKAMNIWNLEHAPIIPSVWRFRFPTEQILVAAKMSSRWISFASQARRQGKMSSVETSNMGTESMSHQAQSRRMSL